MIRVVVALAAIVAAVTAPPLVGVAIALAAVATGGARMLRVWRAPLVTVAIAIALQAWIGGRDAALAMAGRVVGATAAGAWLVGGMRVDELLAALRRLGVPNALVELTQLAARYVGVIGDSMRTAREAQRVRMGTQPLPARLRAYGTVGGVAMARAIDQSVAIGEAMRVRGGARR